MDEQGYILVVEDSPTQAKQLAEILGPLGYNVSMANGGKEALTVIKERKPLLALVDILMPEMDGFQLCKIIKSDDGLKGVPVILLTQLSDPREIVRGLECGADDFIVKPYNEELLLFRIKTVISLKLRLESSGRRTNILIVEDSPTQAEQLKYLLEKQGYSTAVAGNGRQGLALARKMKPTLVVSDIIMPEMDGYELAYEIKHDEELKDTPVILITSLMDRKEILRRASVVADGYFTKPYDDRYLIQKIEHLLARPGDDAAGDPLEVLFSGERYLINAGRRQILTFLLSTYENAVQQNRDLILMQRELQLLNEQLEERVLERAQQLKASEAKYRTLLETNSDAIVVIGDDRTVYFANKAASALLGVKSDKMPWKLFKFPIETGERDVEIKKEKGRSIVEMRVVKTTWGDANANLVILRDRTEERLMEEALRESEVSFRALAENAHDGIVIYSDENGKFAYANRQMEEMTGRSTEALLNSDFKTISDPARYGEDMKFYRRVLGGEDYPRQYETVIARKTGASLPVEITASKTIWHGHRASIIIFRDINERKKRDEELIRASKLESLGTLAGGIAHDFNNLLTGVVGNVSLAKVFIDPDNKVYKMLQELEKASLRAKNLTQQLLTFAKGGAPIKKVLQPNDLIRDSAGFILSGSNIKCDFFIAPDLWPIEADEGQLSQVIHNLIINAEQAMPNGGVIKVSAENVTIGKKDNLPVKHGKFIKLTVRDTGVGIPAENLAKIYDPYFTTKKEGSGLGLATVYSIIKNHDGYLTVESKTGAGAAFHIYLPASESKAVSTIPADDKPVFGKGKVLVMDDEDVVRDVAGTILKEMGYSVDFATEGVEAVEMYRKAFHSGAPYDTVIMDLTIPGGMGGKETMKKLLEIDPGVRGIASSGYSEDSIMADYRKFGFCAVIAKPYRISELSGTVDRVIRKV